MQAADKVTGSRRQVERTADPLGACLFVTLAGVGGVVPETGRRRGGLEAGRRWRGLLKRPGR